MKLGPSLIGTVVGAAVGVAVHLGLESTMDREFGWFAIVIGLLAGLGARWMAGDGIKHTSFVRAGFAAAVALAAIVGSNYAASNMTLKRNMDAYHAKDAEAVAMRLKHEQAASEAEADDAAATDEGTADEAAEADDRAAEEASDDEASDTDDAADASTDSDDEAEESEAEESEAVDDAAVDDAADDAVAEQFAQPDDEAIETREAGKVDLPAVTDAEQAPSQTPPVPWWQYAFFGIGTLLAYELARGGSKQA